MPLAVHRDVFVLRCTPVWRVLMAFSTYHAINKQCQVLPGPNYRDRHMCMYMKKVTGGPRYIAAEPSPIPRTPNVQ